MADPPLPPPLVLYQLAVGHYDSRALALAASLGLAGEADPFAEMERDPEQAATFDRAMAAFTSQTAVAVADACDFSGF